MRRLLLVRHGSTLATRTSAFATDEALDEPGRAAAGALAGLRHTRRLDVLVSPSERCRQTAEAAGWLEPTIDPALAECDFGSWGGRSLADVHAEDGDAVTAWMTDPDAAPHGGESLSAFARRVAAWLDGQGRLAGGAVAVTHGGVVKAAVVHALGAPLSAFWRIDAAPLTLTELHCHDGRWTLVRANCLIADTAGATAS